MAKLGNKKLSKLKSMLKRLRLLSSRLTTTTVNSPDTNTCQSNDGLHPVYVGKSKRKYLITAQLAEHPLLQILLQRSDNNNDGGSNNDGDIVVGCEVVLFEHLLWMLENGVGGNESLDELVEYYAC